MPKITLALEQPWRSVLMQKSYLGKAGWMPSNPPLQVAQGQQKAPLNCNRRQIVD